MTVKIEIEALLPWSADDFRKAVVVHAEAMREYAEHLRGVEEDAANEELKPEDRRIAFPAPSAHPLVEAAVKAGGYELVGPSLEVRKQRLCAKVDAAEQAEIGKAMPPRKARYWQLREQDINKKRSAAFAVGGIVTITVGDDDDIFMEEMATKRAKVAAVQRWAAKAHHDIDDLTDETVDAWKLEPFNE